MLHSKAFIRKTKKGAVIKIVKEHYLRDDLYCGLPNCTKCPVHPSILTGPDPNNGFPGYIVPDTNILYHQIDIMEHKGIENVIILQTVLEELKHRSTPVYLRVRTLIAELGKKFYVFCNEHHRETFVQKHVDESPNDRNDRAIRRAVEWYKSHKEISIIMVTDDAENRKKAVAEGIQAISLRNYVEKLVEYPNLADLVASSGEDELDKACQFSYPGHLSSTQISAGLKSGAFYQGALGISTHNFLEGSVVIKADNEEKTIHLIGREFLNRGVQGDIVAVQILPKSQWKSSVSTIVEEEFIEESEIAVHENNKIDTIPTGQVVGIIKRNWRPFCGTIDAKSVQATSTTSAIQSVFFWSMDKRIPKIRIRTRQAPNLIGKRIIVSIDAWDKESKYPSGHFVRIVGDVGDKVTETEVLLLEYDVPFVSFSPLVLSCLPEEGENWIVLDEHKAKREDFRGYDVCSIDPPGLFIFMRLYRY